MHGVWCRLFFVDVGGYWFEIFSLEDLSAVKALDIIHSVAAGKYNGLLVLTSSRHTEK